MLKYFVTSLSFTFFLYACTNQVPQASSKQMTETNTSSTAIKDTVDANFDGFVTKFSTDSLFQISRIKFPLKVTLYDVSNDKDSTFFRILWQHNTIDLRIEKSNPEGYERSISFNDSKTEAVVLFQKEDTGIMVEYIFVKQNDMWILVAIEDKST